MKLSSLNKNRSLTLNLLRAFIAVVETRQMTLAANRLRQTQSAVSQQIKKLEELFELELFQRKPDAIELTSAGEKLASHAYHLLALTDELFNDMQKADYIGEIRLGVPADVVASILPPILKKFRDKHPDVLITLVSDISHVLRAKFEENKVDIIILTEAHRGNSAEFLVSDRLVWAGANNSLSAKQRPLSVALGNETCAFRSATTNALN